MDGDGCGWGRCRWWEMVAAREEWIVSVCSSLWPVPRVWFEMDRKLGWPSGCRLLAEAIFARILARRSCCGM